MIGILFVCHGNICRSPMAEYWMRHLVEEEGRGAEFVIASAAASDEETGNPAYPPVLRLMESMGVDCSAHRARRLTRNEAVKYDFLIGMDHSNIRLMKRICDVSCHGKIRLLLSFAGEEADVADPWYTGDFRTAFRDIDRGCRALLKTLAP